MVLTGHHGTVDIDETTIGNITQWEIELSADEEPIRRGIGKLKADYDRCITVAYNQSVIDESVMESLEEHFPELKRPTAPTNWQKHIRGLLERVKHPDTKRAIAQVLR